LNNFFSKVKKKKLKESHMVFKESLLYDTLRNEYQLEGTLSSLPGEIDLNYRFEASNGQVFVLKIAHTKENRPHLEMQNAVINHLENKELPLDLPTVLKNQKGQAITTLVDHQQDQRMMRLLRWVPGRIYAQVRPQSPALLESLGAACGHMCAALSDFDHPATHRWYKWDLAQADWIETHLSLFQEEEAELIRYFLSRYQQSAPVYQNLRKSVVYNDANDFNILVDDHLQASKVKGFIDFGDVLHTQTVNDLAIAIAYGAMNKEQPLEAACRIVKGFHLSFPLQEQEVALLYTLVATRLIVSLTVSALNKKEHPENEYLLVSEQPAWRLLRQWKNIPAGFAHFAFRHACGWIPCPRQKRFEQWLRENRRLVSTVIDLNGENVSTLDLSVGSLDLGNNAQFNDIIPFQKTIDRMMEQSGATAGIGGYGEVRPVYTTDAYLVKGNTGPQWRTVHLGVDVWMEAGRPVCAPWDGVVHSFENNAQERDYGPTIIIEHQVNDELTFYTLYGHLSLSSLNGLKKGMPVKKGQKIATIGPAPENGNWPPHLHFQVILDMLDKKGDFPGVGFPEEKEIWLSICPNGASFFNTDLDISPVPIPSLEDLLDTRKQKLGKSLSISYRRPLHILRGFKQYLYDQNGRRYLDTVNNVAHVGHEHPKVVQAAQRQMAVLNTNTRYLHANIIQFAEELLATFPPELNVVHFVNSGSEANELALRMAQTCTGQRDMIAVEVGYHGNTTGCVDISSYKFDGKGGRGAPPHTHIVPIPDTYRGRYRKDPEAGVKYARHVQKAIEEVQSQGRNIGGFFCESILSCGGQIVLPEGYLKEAFQHVRAAGGLCVMDEVQVGFGRVGEKFWGFELQGVVPDVVTMGKPIGNGHPLGAVVTTEEVARQFANGMEYFSTFGGNPVSCAIGSAVLQVIQEEGLQQHAREVGQYLRKNLLELQTQYPLIGDVRGPGLFQGFELVKDPEHLTPAAEEASYLANRAREHGILMSTDGPFENVLKIKPPMCFDKKNVDFLVETLDKVLKEDFLNTLN
jgi:4-aminobutyrate aminotransferase-like enzyme/Ser/Thr protein kinase RdoA (MazF antagonist)